MSRLPPCMKRIVVGATAAIALACAGAPAATAAPRGGFAMFAQCPTRTTRLNGCFYGAIEGGYMAVGRTVVPIAKTVVLQAGTVNEGVHDGAEVKQLVAAVDGETLTKVGQPVPGLPIDAVAELAAPVSSISVTWNLEDEELGLVLPIKVRLVNPALGSECSIGSDLNPIELNLTTGATGGGLTGNPGVISSLENGKILLKSGVSMVSSGFAVPKASGCGGASIDEVIDAALGLPSSKNRVVFNLKMELAGHFAVEASEE